MSAPFDNRVVIVTGAGSGIGRASAKAFAEQGASVVVADVNEESGLETVELIGADQALFTCTDVSSETDVQSMVEATISRFGRLDAAHNNAAVPLVGPRLHKVSEAEWTRLLDVDLKGVWLCLKHQIAYMREHGGGAIVNTSSALGLLAIPNQSSYCAAKAGVLGLTRAAAAEYGTEGIRVNALLPGITRTPMVQYAIDTDPKVLQPSVDAHPIGRIGEPEELAAAAVWLCSDAASFVTGHSMAVDGGFGATPI